MTQGNGRRKKKLEPQKKAQVRKGATAKPYTPPKAVIRSVESAMKSLHNALDKLASPKKKGRKPKSDNKIAEATPA